MGVTSVAGFRWTIEDAAVDSRPSGHYNLTSWRWAVARVPATEFKARCLELMDRVSERRETYVITKRGKAVAKLVPVEWKPGQPLFGRMRGMAEEVGDIVSPVMPEGASQVLTEWDELNAHAPATARRRGRTRGRTRGRAR